MTENKPIEGQLYEKERGQSLVEMAIGMMVLVIIFSGLVDLGRAYFVLIALEDAAGEAALFLSVVPGCETASDVPAHTLEVITSCADPNNAIYRYQHASGAELNWAEQPDTSHRFCRDILADGTCLPPESQPGVGSQYVVELHYHFALITPIISDLVGDDTIVLTVKASQTVISE
jgi:hypothetical protein